MAHVFITYGMRWKWVIKQLFSYVSLQACSSRQTRAMDNSSFHIPGLLYIDHHCRSRPVCVCVGRKIYQNPATHMTFNFLDFWLFFGLKSFLTRPRGPHLFLASAVSARVSPGKIDNRDRQNQDPV